jgi:hypothetical protein
VFSKVTFLHLKPVSISLFSHYVLLIKSVQYLLQLFVHLFIYGLLCVCFVVGWSGVTLCYLTGRLIMGLFRRPV